MILSSNEPGATSAELLVYLREKFSEVLRPHGKEVEQLYFIGLSGQDPLLAKEKIYLQLKDCDETSDLF